MPDGQGFYWEDNQPYCQKVPNVSNEALKTQFVSFCENAEQLSQFWREVGETKLESSSSSSESDDDEKLPGKRRQSNQKDSLSKLVNLNDSSSSIELKNSGDIHSKIQKNVSVEKLESPNSPFGQKGKPDATKGQERPSERERADKEKEKVEKEKERAEKAEKERKGRAEKEREKEKQKQKEQDQKPDKDKEAEKENSDQQGANPAPTQGLKSGEEEPDESEEEEEENREGEDENEEIKASRKTRALVRRTSAEYGNVQPNTSLIHYYLATWGATIDPRKYFE